ncbi:hypothetical protein AJ80_05866 [Polytolypa hystricis UAMH7299]|uniref:C3H1-type domain-containing protein n=1 Tax=Polytolypa hystricis (strain UAMH7299) TaxID=1447883 RepID=A0A2B7XZA4_POLH7|nr:hypothetical protein AJ80_05866 [Polytolypa hystricis UAMH7299]
MTYCEPFRDLYGKLREASDGVYSLVEKVDELEKQLDEKQLLLEKQEDLADMYYQRSKETKAELTKSQQNMERSGFVSVLVDGDSMNFLDDFVRDGESGGREAAHLLISSVTEYIQTELPDLRHDLALVIRIYANMRGLGRVYQDTGILDHAQDLECFVRGFNMGHPMCDFVDAGTGKECSDEKVRETFKLHFGDVHCKHIVFCGSTDNGYARLLGPYSGAGTTCNRITMVEGAPFERELAELKDKFRTTSFPVAFRDTKLPPGRRVSFSAAASSTRSPGPKPSTYASAASQSTAAVNNNASDSRPGTPSPSEKSPSSPSSITNGHNGVFPESKVLRNKKGQRVDAPLKPSSSIVQSLKSRKLCNPYHLLGSCPYTSCRHEHGEQLSDKWMEALRYVARLAPCPAGLECEDEDCYSGHRCPNQPCHRPNCHFPKEMHGVDTKACKIWP